ncbi:hypothetical protein F5Y18DRAFT_161506 [Xylariaceae sp. FL1019]|nr:hypothetical protein F5Y18DRAFT_161506 [Xylariaceae sp. FL1019]
MRLLWYAGASTALATGVVAYAFNQRANFYSAMVYLAQNNLSLMILVNLVLLIHASFVWGLQRLCYGPLRPVEIEQLYEKAWFAVTETCLAMTIFREEVGHYFIVMFTALVTGKVWEWIGEGRVEVLEQQPPTNPTLFHTRLSISLLLSLVYDAWLFYYAVTAVIQQARPNMMVMFLFEFAILGTCSLRTTLRYVLSRIEANIVKKQTQTRLDERRRQAREQRADILRRRESDDTAEAEAAQQEELPDEEDIDEMDIEVPGWESKGHWVLSLDLMTDFVKLAIYSAFFAILMMFYGLPIHIMRDLFMTARSFVKRLGALLRYRKALQDMNKYPDATAEDLEREDTCIICREEMRPWDPSAVGAVERSRPKKLPCGHILHFGCLKGWLERQQVCPTCRRSVVIDGPQPNGAAGPAQPGANGGQPQAPGQPALGGGAPGNPGQPNPARGANMRVFQLGPIRLGFAQGNAQNMQELAERLQLPLDGQNAPVAPAAVPSPTPVAPPAHVNGTSNNMAAIQAQLQDISNRIQQEMYALQVSQSELMTLYALTAELNRLRQLPPQLQSGLPSQPGQTGTTVQVAVPPPLIQSQTTHITYTQAPTVTRHGGASLAAAIPAGSQELPEGVVIPPGWSLLPLERLDVPFAPQAPGAQPTPTTQLHDPQSQETPPAGPSTRSNGVPDTDPIAASIISPAQSPIPDVDNERTRSSEPLPEGQQQREFPDVAAPTPVMPNWGGASQLFANQTSGGSPMIPVHDESRSTADSNSDSGSHDDDTSSEDGDDTTNSSSKGKGRATTVEDADSESD